MDPQSISLSTHVPAAARGDREAFAALVDATRSVVSSIALAIVRDVELSRDVAQEARSVEELSALRKFELTNAGFCRRATAVLFPLSYQLTRQPWSQVATFAGFIIGLVGMYVFWLPRILRTRHEIEALEDPVRAARARAMERRAAILGWSLGLTFGTLGLIAGLWMASR